MSSLHDRFGTDSDFLVLITLTEKAGIPRNRTRSGRRLKTTHADGGGAHPGLGYVQI
jgi:hypothetical protein